MNNRVLNKEALKAWILSKLVTLTNNLLATEPGISAMDAAQGPVIQGQIDEINSNLGGLSFYEDEAGNKYVVGADSVPKKLGNVEYEYVAAIVSGTSSSIYETEKVASSTGTMHYTVFSTSATAKLTVGNNTINIIAKTTEVYKEGSVEVTKGDKIILSSTNTGWTAGTVVVWYID